MAAGRGQGPPQEFYKRNHQWTEGLLSAAKAVGVAARVLVAAADGVVTGSGKVRGRGGRERWKSSPFSVRTIDRGSTGDRCKYCSIVRQ